MTEPTQPTNPSNIPDPSLFHKEAEPIAADYAARVEDMHGMFSRADATENYWDTLDKVWTEYVANETDPAWQQFCAAMLQGGRLTVNNDRIYQLSADEKVRRLSPAEYDELHKIKTSVIEDGHYFRGMLEHHRDNFTMKEISQWYSHFNGGRLQQAIEDVYGAMAEIATWEAAASLPGLLMAVEFGNAEDDGHGGDIKALTTDTLEEVMIDAKSGLQVPEHRRTKTGYKLVVGVPTQIMDAHGRLDAEGKAGMQRNIEYAIRQAVALKQAQ